MLRLAPVWGNMAKPWPPEELIAMAGRQPLLFRPGARQEYSNTNFLMLAVISEKLSGKKYGEQIKEIFVDKPGMKSLLVGDDHSIVPRLSCGYAGAIPGANPDAGKLALPMMASLGVAKGAGNLEASPSDVVRLVNLDRVLRDNLIDTLPLAPTTLPDGASTLVKEKGQGLGMSELNG